MDNLSAKIPEEVIWSTTEMTLTPGEEDTIVTLVVVIIGILAAIILLFSMGLFIDCRTQFGLQFNMKSFRKSGKNGTGKRKRLRLKMPPLGHVGTRREDSKCLAADMCPNGSSEYAATGSIDVVV